MLAYDYPLLGFFWSMFLVALWFAWLMLLFRVIGDLFRTHDMGGLSKALWALFVLVCPVSRRVHLPGRSRRIDERARDRPPRSKFQARVRKARGLSLESPAGQF